MADRDDRFVLIPVDYSDALQLLGDLIVREEEAAVRVAGCVRAMKREMHVEPHDDLNREALVRRVSDAQDELRYIRARITRIADTLYPVSGGMRS